MFRYPSLAILSTFHEHSQQLSTWTHSFGSRREASSNSPLVNKISFCNIRDVHSKLDQVSFHVQNSRLQMLLLTETYLMSKNFGPHLQCIGYQFHAFFLFKVGSVHVSVKISLAHRVYLWKTNRPWHNVAKKIFEIIILIHWWSL